jgi:hypothetical protein
MKAYWGSGGIVPLILDLGTRWILEEQTGRVWTGFIWLMIGVNGGIL